MRHIAMTAAVCALALAGPCMAARTASGRAGAGAPGQPATARDESKRGAAAPLPALWRTYDYIVNLENLPRTYTCDDLWYEFHGILLRLGAWPYSINILPYHCSPAPSGTLRSPDVEARFQLPFFLKGAAAKWAPAKAVERAVRLAPGEPKTLHASDCLLMRQISDRLLKSLPVRVEEHFDCSAPRGRAADFHVTVTLPVAVKAPAPAATSAPAPR